VSASDDTLAARLAPYRETPGLIAALLVSRDGFVVAADAEAGFAAEAVAAQVAGVIDIGARLAHELGDPAAKYVTLGFESRNVVLAPFGDELMLVLVGTPDALSCTYRISRPGG
jgi:predicted regulator of Ras-like GTPase activity (Roadblock/LC7/MglB family)